MGADKLDKYQPCMIGQGCHQAIIVALDVENRAAPLEDARSAELRLDVCRCLPLRAANRIMPGAQRLLGIGVSFID